MIALPKNIKIVGVAPVYNELEKGHLERFLKNVFNVVDEVVFLDDASTDGSYERLLEFTPNVIRNNKNMFLYEHFNTQRLIQKALELYPDLTHIMNLNIDSTFSTPCFKDGEALLHKACREQSRHWDMLTIRDINLWRSPYYWRIDHDWKWHRVERIYIRDKSLEMLDLWHKGLHKMRVTAAQNSTACITQMKGFGGAVTVHWGFKDRELIRNKFHYYMSIEERRVPCPEAFHVSNVFNLLDEYNVQTAQISEEWVDAALRDEIVHKKRPRPVSYYSDIKRYNINKAECYKRYFEEVMGYHDEDTEYF